MTEGREKYSRKGVKVKVTEGNLHEYLEQIRIEQSKATFKREERTAIHYNEYRKEKEGEKY